MKRLVLHIGGPKCGSSTLQNFLGTYFSEDAGVINRDGDTLRYAAIAPDGSVVQGKHLRRSQAKSDFKYVPSAIFPSDPDAIFKNLKKLENAVGKNDTVILSNEGWANAVTPTMAAAFDRLGVPVHVFFVTRPPVDWMNASWWQWGVWTEHSLEKWVRSQISAVKFHSQIEKWNSFDAVESLKVVDLSQDIRLALTDFLNVDLNEDDQQKKDINVGTNFHLLRHLVNNKEKYGRTIHNPAIEFRLNGLLNLDRLAPPFVIPSDLAKWIISNVRPENEKLVELLFGSGHQTNEQAVRKYLDHEAYADRVTVDADSALIPREDDALIGALVDAVLRANEAR